MANTAPKLLPLPPVKSYEELTLEMLMQGIQLTELADIANIPKSTISLKERGPGTVERPISKRMMYFRIRSRAQDNFYYSFLCEVGWRGLFAPKELVPPDMLLHDFYTDYAEILKPEEISSEYQIREKAKAIVLEREGFGAGLADERSVWRSFIIKSAATNCLYRFYTLDNWRGLKAPRRVVPNSSQGYVNVKYIDVYSESELEGRSKVRKAAMEYVKSYEALQAAPRKDKQNAKNFTICLNKDYLARFNAVRSYLAYIDAPSGISAVVRWLIDNADQHVPPQKEWDKIRKETHKKQMKERLKDV